MTTSRTGLSQLGRGLQVFDSKLERGFDVRETDPLPHDYKALHFLVAMQMGFDVHESAVIRVIL